MKNFFSTILLVATFLVSGSLFAQNLVEFSIENRRAEEGKFRADIYAEVAAGETWDAVSQTFALNFNPSALDPGTNSPENTSTFSGYIVDVTSFIEGNLTLNISKFSAPFAQLEGKVLVGTIVWDVVDGTELDNITFADELGGAAYFNGFTQLNRDCGELTCYGFTNPTPVTIELGAPYALIPEDGSFGLVQPFDAEWTAPEDPRVDSYDVEVSIDNFATTEVSVNISVPNTSVEVDGLADGQEFQWRVRSRTDEGVTSDWVMASGQTQIGEVTLISPLCGTTNLSDTGFEIDWTPVDGAVEYEIVLVGTMDAYNNFAIEPPYNFVANLENNEEYQFYIIAYDADGNEGKVDLENSCTIKTRIDVSYIVSPEDEGTGVLFNPQTQFSWATVAGAANYDLEVYQEGQLIEEQTVAITTTNVTELEPFTTYTARVRANDAEGNGRWSEEISFTTLIGVPENNDPADGDEGVEITPEFAWSEVPGAAYYELNIYNEMESLVASITTESTSDNSTTLEYLSTYTWNVAAYQADDMTGGTSETTSFTTIIEAPATTVITSPEDGDVDVSLSGEIFYDAADRADATQVQIATDEEFNTIVADEFSLTSSYAYSNLANDTEHFARARGINDGGNGEWSETVSFTTVALAPPVVTAPTGDRNFPSDLTLTWDDGPGAVAYNVWVYSDEEMMTLVTSALDTDENELALPELDYASTYYVVTQSITEEDALSELSVTYMFTTVEEGGITGDLEPCESTVRTYSVSPNLNYVTYSWSVEGGTIVGSATGSSVTVNWGDMAPTSLTVERNAEEWGENSDEATQEIELLPITEVDVMIEAVYTYEGEGCILEPIEFEAVTEAELQTVTWNFGDETPAVNGSIVVHKYTEPGTYTVTVSIEGEGCVVGTDSYIIEVVDDCPINIDLALEGATAPVCSGISVSLVPTVWGGDGNYSYSYTDTTYFVDPKPENGIGVIAETFFTDDYTLTVTDGNGLEAEEKFTLYVNPRPAIIAKPSFRAKIGVPVDLVEEIDLKNADYELPLDYIIRDKDGIVVEDPTSYEFTSTGLKKFSVVLFDENGCSSSEKPFFARVSSGKEGEVTLSQNGTAFIASYPNPSINELNVIVDFGEMVNFNAKIVSLTGQEVLSFYVSGVSQYEGVVNVSDLTQGVYFLVIETGNDTIIHQFVKQ